MRRTSLTPFAGVEGQTESLALGNGECVNIACRGRLVYGAGLGLRVAKEQMIRDVFVVVAALLRQEVIPAQQFEQGANQLHLGRGFVDGVKVDGLVEQGERVGAEGAEDCGLGEGFLPSGGVQDAFFEKVAGEKLARHCKGLVSVSRARHRV